jgi:hypothetical protein
MEKGDIVAVRLKFWRKIHRLREFSDSRPVFYLDETRANISGRITLGTVGSKYLYGKQAVLSLATQDRLIRVSNLRARGCYGLNALVTITIKWPPLHFEIAFQTDLLFGGGGGGAE